MNLSFNLKKNHLLSLVLFYLLVENIFSVEILLCVLVHCLIDDFDCSLQQTIAGRLQNRNYNNDIERNTNCEYTFSKLFS